MADLDLSAAGHLRAGLRLSAASVAWTVVSSGLAVVIGLRGGSLVLVAFGLTGVLDAAGSIALVSHFRHAIRHDTFSERHERRALRVVISGLLVVGTVTGVERARRLLSGGR